MSVQLKIEKKADHIVATFAGEDGLEEISQKFGNLAERCRSEKRSKILINIAGVKSVPTFSERYQAGEKAAVFAEFGIKVAVVGLPEQLDPGRLAELVARNRGVDGRVFTNLAAAENWLLE